MYHEHLLYYRLENLSYLLDMHGMEIFKVEFANVHGGSMISYACLKGEYPIDHSVIKCLDNEKRQGMHEIGRYIQFGHDVKNNKNKIYNFVNQICSSGNSVFAFGAPAKGTVMLNYCQLTNKHIQCATEKNSLKFGLYIPGTGIPIYDENSVAEPDYYFMLSWNFAEEFCRSKSFVSGKRKFIIPIPYPCIKSAN